VDGLCQATLGADVEAVGWFRRSIEANRNVPLAHFSLAAALALQGLLDQAQTAAKAGLDLDPNFSLRRFRNNAAGNNPTYLAGRNRFSQGLRIAGGPEG
jgi:tetratricopeptide (TPR) repeat protein